MKVRSILPAHEPGCTRHVDGPGGMSYPGGTEHEHVPDVEHVQVTIVRFSRGSGCCRANVGREVTAIYTMDGKLLAEVDRCPTQGEPVGPQGEES